MSLEPASLLSLFLVMLVLASIPSISVLTVCARTVSFGYAHGLMVTLGIVSGDIIFIIIAILGLSLLVQALGEYFLLIQVAAGLYLVWLGLALMRVRGIAPLTVASKHASLVSSYLAGLMITLPDQKALLFYLGFFPAFVNLPSLGMVDGLVMVGLAALAVGVPKLVYAYLANHMRLHLSAHSAVPYIYRLAGLLLLLVGYYLISAIFRA